MERRGFLKALGLGLGAAVVPAAAVAQRTVSVDPAVPGAERTAFHFICPCGEGLIAEVPREEGKTLIAECGCGTAYMLRWNGDSFSVIPRDSPAFAPEPEMPDWIKEHVDALRKNRDLSRKAIYKALDQ